MYKRNSIMRMFPLKYFRKVKRLRNKKVASIKLLLRNPLVEGATWEDESSMKSGYPHLFPNEDYLSY